MSLKKYTYTEKKDTRSGFGEGIYEAGKENENVVALCADLIGSLKLDKFIDEFPERFFQVGIAEANMIWLSSRLNDWRKNTCCYYIRQFWYRKSV
ncbi:MAG: hypothetical protein R2728_16085 [Chitinophagales bacterium]